MGQLSPQGFHPEDDMEGSGQAYIPAAGGWGRSVLDEPRRLEDEHITPRMQRSIDRVAHGQALRELFRSEIYKVGTYFPLVGGGFLGPLKRKDGSVLVWQGLWLPHRRAIFEEFKKQMPSDADMAARDEFCKANGIAYGYARPGHVFGPEDVAEWLDSNAAVAAK